MKLITPTIFITIASFSTFGQAKTKKKTKKNTNLKVHAQLIKARQLYHTKKIRPLEAWKRVEILSSKTKNKQLKAEVIQFQARILRDNRAPILSALFAKKALKLAPNPLAPELANTWVHLNEARSKRSVQEIINELAIDLGKPKKTPAGFGANWYYIYANAVAPKSPKTAMNFYKKLSLKNRQYLSARYNIAIMHINDNDAKKAQKELLRVSDPSLLKLANLTSKDRTELKNLGRLALARLHYQKENFRSSLKYYRAIDRNSEIFYDSIFEQSWAFFMAGYPNHALGALHSAESPFFKTKFNPEAAVLRAIIYYWMCRYDDSRAALADFTRRHADDVEDLEDFLSKRHLRTETAYQLFEDYANGVSEKSLGISKRVLETAATQEAMLYIRDQYAAAVGELGYLRNKGILGSRRIDFSHAKPLKKHVSNLRKKLGEQYLVELKELAKHYDRLKQQAKFLYIELLMSEKEKLYGRDLHASSKIDRVTRRKKISGWGNANQSWAGAGGQDEYWWDEIGFHIYDIRPQCKGH